MDINVWENMGNGDILSLADKVIEILKERKSIDLSELARCAGADASEVKKIIDLFEKEDMLKVGYQLTKTQITWLGDTCPVPEAEESSMIEVSGKGKAKKDKRYYVSEPAIKLTDFESKNGNGKNGNGNSNGKRNSNEPVKPLNVFIPEHFKTVPTVKSIPTAKLIPVPPAQPKPQPQTQPQPVANAAASQAKPAKSILAAPKETPAANGMEPEARGEMMIDRGADADALSPDALSSELQMTLGDVQTGRQELVELNTQRERFLEERYEPLAKRLDIEIGTITEMIIEKEREINQQKERAKALIEKVGDAEVGAIKIHDSEIQARNEFEKAMASLEKMIDRLREIRKGLGYEVRTSKRILLEQSGELKGIDSSIESLADNEKEIDRKITLAKARIAEEERGIESIRISLNEARKTRETIKRRMNEIYEVFSAGRMKEMEDKISSIAQIEGKLEACRQEYSNAISDIKKSSKENAEAVEKLRETIQANFVRKVAKELERTEKDYESKMSDAFEDEKDLVRRIDSAKERLSSKVRHAKDLAQKLKEITPPGRDITDAKMMLDLKELEETEMKGTIVADDKTKMKRIKIIDDLKGLFSRFKEKMTKGNN